MNPLDNLTKTDAPQELLPPETLPAPLPSPEVPAPTPPMGGYQFPGVTQLAAPANTVTTPGLNPAKTVDNILAPQIKAGQDQVIKEAQNAISSANAAPAFPVLYSPPDLTGIVEGFSAQNRGMGEQIAALQAQDNGAQDLLRQLRAIPQKQGGSTADGFDWVRSILGTTEDGPRSYTGPATFNKKTGQWEGTPIGGILYAIGLAQNVLAGGALDVGQGVAQVKNNFNTLPDWIKSPLAKLGDATRIGGMALPYGGAVDKLIGMLPTNNAYYDGKSNIVEAFKGAQYSFSDDIGKGFGIKRNVGVRIGAAPGKGFGFDLNPTVIGGVALDVLTGAAADKLITRVGKLAKLGRVAEVLTLDPSGTSVLKKGEPTVLQTPTQLQSQAQAAPPTQAATQFTQLPLPFLLEPKIPPKKVAKVKTPDQLRIPTPKATVPAVPRPAPVVIQQVLPIAQMLTEDLAIQGYPAKVVRSGQLVLPLGVVRQQPPARTGLITATEVLTPPAIKTPKPRQLRIDFTALPEALPPTIIKQAPDLLPVAVDIGRPAKNIEDVLASVTGQTPIHTATIHSSLVGQAKVALADNLEQAFKDIEDLANIGRKFTHDTVERPTLSLLPDGEKGIPQLVLPTGVPFTGEGQFFHGTRVGGLKLNEIDPLVGGARNELGLGVYMSRQRGVAEVVAKADPAANVPIVEGKVLLDGGEVHTVTLNKPRLVVATKPSAELTILAQTVAANAFPQELGGVFRGKMSLVQVYDAAAKAMPGEALGREFQRHMAVALGDMGYDGAMAKETVVIFNPSKIRPRKVEAVVEGASSSAADSRGYRMLAEQSAVEQTGSEIAQVNAGEAKAAWLAQSQHDLGQVEVKVQAQTEQAIKDAGLMEPPVPTPHIPDPGRFAAASKQYESMHLTLVLAMPEFDKEATAAIYRMPIEPRNLHPSASDIMDVTGDGAAVTLDFIDMLLAPEHVAKYPPDMLPMVALAIEAGKFKVATMLANLTDKAGLEALKLKHPQAAARFEAQIERHILGDSKLPTGVEYAPSTVQRGGASTVYDMLERAQALDADWVHMDLLIDEGKIREAYDILAKDDPNAFDDFFHLIAGETEPPSACGF